MRRGFGRRRGEVWGVVGGRKCIRLSRQKAVWWWACVSSCRAKNNLIERGWMFSLCFVLLNWAPETAAAAAARCRHRLAHTYTLPVKRWHTTADPPPPPPPPLLLNHRLPRGLSIFIIERETHFADVQLSYLCSSNICHFLRPLKAQHVTFTVGI